ncbi:hypothetical protein LPTSP3_g25250 [Leptospira kobayashii]|uniref:DUF1554 domain-containing protein n=1 Tax=Leptospira kobayashii TaxID=1917830 RepID=A0ABM7UL02_9LEPT|nr:DUF1554 domain-containing protein [Leptospira kobayashii]BDA79595.1 hypothetical protein LPTSP3_g25250 [Leptospira kobayashii]
MLGSNLTKYVVRSSFLIIILFTSYCTAASNAADQFLFGLSETVDKSPAGVTVKSLTGGYSVSENPSLGTLGVTLQLNRQPIQDVKIPLSLDNPAIATLSIDSMTFTTSNWDTPQTVTISGVNNDEVDGNKDTIIVIGKGVSTDALYSGLITPTRPLTVIDDDSYSVVVSPKSLQTTEAAGAGRTTTFTVVLASKPTSTVTIPTLNPNVDSTNNTGQEGTIDKTSLTFTTTNFNIPQVVTVTGVDDVFLDGNKTYTIQISNSTSTDPNYSNLAVPSVTVVNIDNELPGIVVTPTTLSINEADTNGTFTVVLTNPPTGNVTIPVTNPNPTRATVSTTLLTFTTGNYNTPQTVTVTPVNNLIADGNSSFTLDLGIATNYGNENAPDVAITIVDNDTPGVTVVQLNQNIVEGTLQTAFFRLRLNSEPTANVTIPINDTFDAKNTGHRQGSAAVTSVTFTPSNWNTYQDITVTPVNDDVADGNFQWVIELQRCVSTDPKYGETSPGAANGIKPTPNITVNEDDDDIAGFTIVAYNKMDGSTSLIQTAKSATTVTGFATDDSHNLDPQSYSRWTIRLRSQPLATVNLSLTTSTSGTTNDGTLNTNSLTFTTANWATPQTVFVTGASNGANEGNLDYSVNVTATGDDLYGNGSYGYRDSAQVARPAFTIYSCDNDVANQIIGCRRSGTFSTTEGGGTGIFHLITQSDPGSSVTVPVSSNNLAEGTVGSATATITSGGSGNWKTMTTSASNQITATGVQDANIDGNIAYTIVLGTSSGGLTIDPPDMTIYNIDDELVVEVSAGSNDTSEDGTTATFGVRIRNTVSPTANVTFTIACKSGSTECSSLSASSLTFTPANFNTYQTITVTPTDDSRADNTQAVCVQFGTVVSTDLALNDFQPPDNCPMNNLDNDKIIFVTNQSFNPNFNDSNNDLTEQDGFCQTDTNRPTWGTYKALISNTVSRVATTTGTDATGQNAWVLAASKGYYLATGFSAPYTNRVFTTNTNKLFSFGSLTTALPAGTYWTGLNSNWTTATNNCVNWSQNDPSDPTPAGGIYETTYGSGSSTTSSSISGGVSNCLTTTTRKLICVQQ